MRELIKAALFTPTVKGWGLPIIFWGPPGVAKTDLIESVTSEYGLYLKHLSPGELGEGAFGVTPMPVKNGSSHYITYPDPDWLLELEEHDGRGVVFVDEATHAPRSVQPAILGLIQARRIAGAPLGNLCRVLAAANPPNEGSGGYELTDATANRLGHVNWVPPGHEAWSSWLWSLDSTATAKPEAPKDAQAEEARVMKAWPGAFNAARTTVTAFIAFKRAILHDRPKNGQEYRAWPSRRTWYMATLSLASAEVHKLSEEDTDTLIAGFVGDAAATEMAAHAASFALPNIDDLLDGVTEFKHDEMRLDITYAVLASCAGTVANTECARRSARVTNLWKMLEDLLSTGSADDLAVTTAKALMQAQPHADGSRLTAGKTAQRVLTKLRPSLEAAGYGR